MEALIMWSMVAIIAFLTYLSIYLYCELRELEEDYDRLYRWRGPRH